MAAPASTLATPPVARSTSARGRRRTTTRIGYAFAAPFLLLFGVFMALPILASFVLSFTDFGLANLTSPFDTAFVGLANYVALFSDQTFLQAALNTTLYTVGGVVSTLALGLAAAVGVNRALGRFRAIFRVGYYLPVVTSIVAIAVIWRFLLDPSYGLLNDLLRVFGFKEVNWLGDSTLALPTITAIIVWRNLGNTMVLFLAGLQGISADIYEAARIDGANRRQEFFGITWPLLHATTLFAAVMTTIGYLQVFEEPFVMTQGGPLNKTLSVSIYMYQQGFNFFHLGYASAIAYTMFVVIAAVTFLQFRVLRSET
ncbi:MAG: sugar ABC transporter permease [Chloroflexota bacterium]|nr:sugar ABC transporter permease [Chloroflexota bacterium]